jgi:hypothetical protein
VVTALHQKRCTGAAILGITGGLVPRKEHAIGAHYAADRVLGDHCDLTAGAHGCLFFLLGTAEQEKCGHEENQEAYVFQHPQNAPVRV